MAKAQEGVINSQFVPEGWAATHEVDPQGKPAIRFVQLEGDRERDWVMMVAGKNEDGTYTKDQILLERGAVMCLEHQIQYAPEDDQSIIADRLEYARAVEAAGRIMRSNAAVAGKGQ